MLGRLPLRYQVAVWATGVTAFALLGGCVAVLGASELLASATALLRAALLGAALGALAAAVFLHLLEHPQRHRVEHRHR